MCLQSSSGTLYMGVGFPDGTGYMSCVPPRQYQHRSLMDDICACACDGNGESDIPRESTLGCRYSRIGSIFYMGTEMGPSVGEGKPYKKKFTISQVYSRSIGVSASAHSRISTTEFLRPDWIIPAHLFFF